MHVKKIGVETDFLSSYGCKHGTFGIDPFHESL